MSKPDPIAELLRALDSDGKPTLAWLVEWSHSGSEPVLAAWEASRSADAMAALLAKYVPNLLELAVDHLERNLGPGWYHRQSFEIAPVLRTVVPVPPSLEELMAKRVR